VTAKKEEGRTIFLNGGKKNPKLIGRNRKTVTPFAVLCLFVAVV
jgi:hypothetical protein